MRQRLSRRDWLLIAICAILAIASIVVVHRYFDQAFPEASIDFRYDRGSSRAIAEQLLRSQKLETAGMKHAVRFDSDSSARIFLERSLGLERATKVMRDQVDVWSWHHRWFRPLVEEELSVDVAPDGDLVAFVHVLPEDRAIASPDVNGAKTIAEEFLKHVRARDLTLVTQSERKLPRRMQRIFTYEAKGIRPAGAPYRHVVTVDGNVVSAYERSLKIPEAWIRSYRELRSKNSAAGAVDTVLMAALMVAAVIVFIVRLRRGDLHLRFVLVIAAVSVVLSLGVTLNEMPSNLAYYDTTSSYASFIGSIVMQALIQCVGTAMLLIVICGAGEVLYRERLPQQLAIPKLWTPRALTSRKVFLSMILGYALVPLFIAYQTVFYLTAAKFGAWSPAEVPYDDMMNSVAPWFAVLFAGFFPAFSEEFLSRAFSIPLLQRFLRSRWTAIIVAGFIWGFGHSTYPNQPFWIRGVEVGLVGVVCGLLMDRFGILALLIWHYTIDAVYTATLLFTSGNAYYVGSAAAASLVFAVPLFASIALYIRNKGFVDDDALTNASLPIEPPPEVIERKSVRELPPPMPVTRTRVMICIALLIVAGVAIAFKPASPEDAIDYRMTADEAKRIAGPTTHARTIVTPASGFRSWNPQSSREEGGSPAGFDDAAAHYLLRNGVTMEQLLSLWRTKIEAATYSVRSFTPLQTAERFVEVDPRTARVVGFHEYQDEQARGATLDQNAALLIARNTFAGYGVDVGTFDLKEALSFQQPNRRDWLFHFEERTPIAAQAFRRVSVRVAGNRVTQFAKHIKVPESVHREAGTQTFLHLLYLILQLLGVIALLALVIAGLVMATRAHGLPWRRAAKWTAILAVIPIASVLIEYESMLFDYNTAVAWETFRVRLITSVVQQIALRLGLLFLALAGLEAAMPHALTVLTKEGQARVGRSAVVAALTAISLLILGVTALQFLQQLFPAGADVSLWPPLAVQTPFPALFVLGRAMTAALIVGAAAALYREAMQKHAALVMALSLFAVHLTPSATNAQMPVMLVKALGTGIVAFVLARYVLGRNPLAWGLTLFLVIVLESAATLLANQRIDLIVNGWALVAVSMVTLVRLSRAQTI
ncbi:MAG TPA: CPBP family intramembrane glutamic endopeptidase [Thermoanaerobaculia bacterium]|jgi:membrane protease YdiL (CAAX protease family)